MNFLRFVRKDIIIMRRMFFIRFRKLFNHLIIKTRFGLYTQEATKISNFP